MPRQMRDIGKTGWAHIILRGINRENLFYDEADHERFFETIDRFSRECNAEIAAICLMSNHVHMLLGMEDGAYAQLMKKIGVSYSKYYNAKYDRVGHVFQDRFRSEAIQDEKHLLIVLRYIYQNPQKAGTWSAKNYPYTRIDRKGILSAYFNTKEELEEFLNAEETENCLEFDSVGGYTDEEVLALLSKLTESDNPQLLQSVEKKRRNEILRKLKGKGITIKQISRLTGINRNMVQRA